MEHNEYALSYKYSSSEPSPDPTLSPDIYSTADSHPATNPPEATHAVVMHGREVPTSPASAAVLRLLVDAEEPVLFSTLLAATPDTRKAKASERVRITNAAIEDAAALLEPRGLKIVHSRIHSKDSKTDRIITHRVLQIVSSDTVETANTSNAVTPVQRESKTHQPYLHEGSPTGSHRENTELLFPDELLNRPDIIRRVFPKLKLTIPACSIVAELVRQPIPKAPGQLVPITDKYSHYQVVKVIKKIKKSPYKDQLQETGQHHTLRIKFLLDDKQAKQITHLLSTTQSLLPAKRAPTQLELAARKAEEKKRKHEKLRVTFLGELTSRHSAQSGNETTASEWPEGMNCLGLEEFYDIGKGGSAAAANLICSRCVVQDECLSDALFPNFEATGYELIRSGINQVRMKEIRKLVKSDKLDEALQLVDEYRSGAYAIAHRNYTAQNGVSSPQHGALDESHVDPHTDYVTSSPTLPPSKLIPIVDISTSSPEESKMVYDALVQEGAVIKHLGSAEMVSIDALKRVMRLRNIQAVRMATRTKAQEELDMLVARLSQQTRVVNRISPIPTPAPLLSQTPMKAAAAKSQDQKTSLQPGEQLLSGIAIELDVRESAVMPGAINNPDVTILERTKNKHGQPTISAADIQELKQTSQRGSSQPAERKNTHSQQPAIQAADIEKLKEKPKPDKLRPGVRSLSKVAGEPRGSTMSTLSIVDYPVANEGDLSVHAFKDVHGISYAYALTLIEKTGVELPYKQLPSGKIGPVLTPDAQNVLLELDELNLPVRTKDRYWRIDAASMLGVSKATLDKMVEDNGMSYQDCKQESKRHGATLTSAEIEQLRAMRPATPPPPEPGSMTLNAYARSRRKGPATLAAILKQNGIVLDKAWIRKQVSQILTPDMQSVVDKLIGYTPED